MLPPGVPRLSVEAGSPLGWERYVGSDGVSLGLRRFGASAPGPVVYEKLGFSVEHVVEAAVGLLDGRKGTR